MRISANSFSSKTISIHGTRRHEPSQPIFNPTVSLEILDSGQIAVLTLTDRARANAMSPEMGDAFRATVEKLKSATDLRVAIITGDGKDFSIGGARQMLADLADPKHEFEYRRTFMLGFYDRWLSALDIPVPTIAAIQGECIGIAPIFACVSDITLAEDTTKLHVTFTNLGFYPGMALSYPAMFTILRYARALPPHDVQTKATL